MRESHAQCIPPITICEPWTALNNDLTNLTNLYLYLGDNVNQSLILQLPEPTLTRPKLLASIKNIFESHVNALHLRMLTKFVHMYSYYVHSL